MKTEKDIDAEDTAKLNTLKGKCSDDWERKFMTDYFLKFLSKGSTWQPSEKQTNKYEQITNRAGQFDKHKGMAIAKRLKEMQTSDRYPMLSNTADTVRVSPCGPNSKNAGRFNITDAGEYPNNTWYGTLGMSGDVRTSRSWNKIASDALDEIYRTISGASEITDSQGETLVW
jgi:hypothetical protein